MKITNYSSIADKYDKNQYRSEEIRFDQDLREYIDNHQQSEYHVLDLSCGTGLYLVKQMKAFVDYPIRWHGIDASEAMLTKAKEKIDQAIFVKGYAENMPYQPGTFDFISNNYAFHHYGKKEQALKEIERVLRIGGIYKYHNIAIHDMTKWWVYHYFPSAHYEDLKRFWNKEVLFHELTARGFQANLKIEYKMEELKVADYLHFAENRDISVLTLINDSDYHEGLERMRFDVNKNPEKTIPTDFAEMFCIAQKI
ncbi:class I SAM-dependent methyltransferase [Neobacillus niacini]|uniref:class I SAM-dependent methyltransferase n=1 Tax=Neobacillus niacini TaxID=86668 RepID=UPI0021CB23CC|nr:class I SAM-dependent methyltransferase [Neobacillus niacini]MCM3764764.1 class I SAM-dependent methyltransferase [Neobacillus niacini]